MKHNMEFRVIFPIVLVLLGFLIKNIGIVERKSADLLIKLVFYIFLPATLFYSLIRLELKPGLLILPVSAFLVALLCYGFAFIIKNLFDMNRKIEGIFLIGSGAMNQGLFAYPFFIIYLGTTGLSYVTFYDVGQAILGLTLGYYIATRYGGKSKTYFQVIKNALYFPPLIAFFTALLLNYLNFQIQVQAILPMIETLHNCTAPLIMIALGIFLEPRMVDLKPVFGVVFIRFVFALGAAFLIVNLIGLSDIERMTVLVASTVPPAMLTLVYAVEEELDKEFTAVLLSICICIGLVYTPALFSILS
ncbi:MAG TPA: AEC family transporter [Candidatus Altiarchaeales archaeon]|nr:AEC family transporter [Candidatus Altiarchaeales archaeon]